MPKFLAVFLIFLAVFFVGVSSAQQANPQPPAVQKSTPARQIAPPPREQPSQEAARQQAA